MNRPHIDNILGADRLLQRFGAWPSFHDAEVIALTLDRRGPTAEMLLHTWTMTDKVDERGYYVLEKHTLVRFVLERIVTCDPSFGLGGSIVCGRIVIADVAPCDADGQPVVED